MHHDIFCGPQEQATKKYEDDGSSLPRKGPLMVHVTEMLNQANGPNVVEGGWVGGDVWFGYSLPL